MTLTETTEASAAPASADPAQTAQPLAPPLHPEPDWVTRAADEKGWDWVRQNWNRAAAVPGAWFDEKKAQAAVDNWPRWFRFTILHFAGAPFVLDFDQECIVRLFFGWKHPVETFDAHTRKRHTVFVRIFRELRYWVPRKRGKTEFIAALALALWYYEGLPGGEGYCFARDENQARVPFDRMKRLIGASTDDMQPRIRCHADQLWCQHLLAPFFLIT